MCTFLETMENVIFYILSFIHSMKLFEQKCLFKHHGLKKKKKAIVDTEVEQVHTKGNSKALGSLSSSTFPRPAPDSCKKKSVSRMLWSSAGSYIQKGIYHVSSYRSPGFFMLLACREPKHIKIFYCDIDYFMIH